MLGAIDVPFVVVQNLGYFNLHQFGSLRPVRATPRPRPTDKWLILGPPMYELPVLRVAARGARRSSITCCAGTDNGYAEQPHVRYWVDGAGQDRRGESTATAFPPADGEVRRLHLASAGADHDTHRLTTDADGRGAELLGRRPARGPRPAVGWTRSRTQILTFDLPITEDLKLAGPVTAQPDVQLQRDRLLRDGPADPDRHRGQPHTSCRIGGDPPGRPAPRTRPAAPPWRSRIDSGRREPLVPGEPVMLRFSLTAGPVRLRTGETLRLDVGSRTDLLRKDPSRGLRPVRPPGAALPVPQHPALRRRRAGSRSPAVPVSTEAFVPDRV